MLPVVWEPHAPVVFIPYPRRHPSTACIIRIIKLESLHKLSIVITALHTQLHSCGIVNIAFSALHPRGSRVQKPSIVPKPIEGVSSLSGTAVGNPRDALRILCRLSRHLQSRLGIHLGLVDGVLNNGLLVS